MRVTIGVVYEKVKLDARRSNIKRLEEAIDKLVRDHGNVKVIVLPAYPFTGPLSVYDQSKTRRVVWSNAERVSTGANKLKYTSVIATMSRWGSEYNAYIIGGPIIERAGPKVYSTVVAVSPKGEIVGRYRKVSLTKIEEEAGLSSGRQPGLINIDDLNLTIGVFVEDDLAYPELFRLMQIHEANIVLGFALPYYSQFFGGIREVGLNILSMDIDVIASFITTRSKETGLPIILVGGAVEVSSSNRERLYVMPIIPVEPDIGIIRDKVKTVDDLGTSVVIEVDTTLSKPRTLRNVDQIALKLSCKALERSEEAEVE